MKTSVALTTNTELKDLFQPLNWGQKLYLCLRLADYPKAKALKIISRKNATLDDWHTNPDFKALEDHILGNASEYRLQALEMFTNTIGLEATIVLADLVHKGLEWEDLDRFDKPYVMQAAQLFKRLSSSKKETSGDNYDELILKRHIKR